MSYKISDIAQIIHARRDGHHDYVVSQLLIDSRKLVAPSTSLFFALKGPRRDGNQYLHELYRKGVRNFVVSKGSLHEQYDDANFLEVESPLQALQELAAFHRQRFAYPVIGITGSNGKTIVKEWLYQLLKDEFSIVRSPKSYNSQVGVPLSLWQMSEEHSLAIIEAGISMPGEMERLAQMIRPGIGILTSIGNAHDEGFQSTEQKFREKARLFQDSDWVISHSKYDPQSLLPGMINGKSLYCGERDEDDLKIISLKKGTNSTDIQLRLNERIAGGKEFYLRASIPFTDEASIDNIIVCIATWMICVPNASTEIEKLMIRLSTLEPVEMRMQLKKGINNCTIINDSYSNDISSLAIALDYLKQQAGNASSTVILSDILQSGQDQQLLYQQVALELKRRNIQRLIGIGEQLSSHYNLFADAVPESNFYLTTQAFLAEATSHQFRESFILLKGARAFAFEKINQWLEQKLHQTVLEINLNSIVHNLKEYQQHLAPTTRIMGMVKAFAYGSGGAEIANILQYQKIDYLGVAYADEGIELRKAGISLPVMVMNPEPVIFEALVENNLEPEIYSFALLESFTDYLEKQGIRNYPIHIEIETGMNRLGFALHEVKLLGQNLKSNPHVKVSSVFSHLSGSENPEEDQITRQQFERFQNAVQLLEQEIGYGFIKHIANSAAILRHPSMQLDMVRLGIGMYGVNSSKSTNVDLKPVATLRTTVAQIKKLNAGESVSYNRRGVVSRESLIATVRLGYADGYPRRLGNGRGRMFIKGVLVPVIGTVCMDMTMLDITDVPGIQEGDDVIVFGESVPIEEVATWAETIPYEIMTGISQRVKRVYFEE